MAAPGAGFLRFNLYRVDARAEATTRSKRCCKQALRLLLALCFAYCGCLVLLAVVAVAVHPLGSCVGLGEALSLELCECTCFVAQVGHPDLPFYHPAATLEQVVQATIEPDLVRERSASLCGPCPARTARCTAAQAAQAAPRFDVFVGPNASLACYAHACVAAVERLAPDVNHGALPTPAGACQLQRAANNACGPTSAVAGCA
jgi:hypothetical protein